MKNALNELWQAFASNAPRLLIAAVIFLIFYIIGSLLRRFFKRGVIKNLNNSIVATFSGEVLFWLSLIIGSLVAARALGFTNIAGSILAGAGISAIIFGFAFKDILENFLAGFIIAVQKPFKVGDIIEVSSYKGPVRALELRSTLMRLADGRDIWIPNSFIVKGILTNYTRDGLLRHEFIIGIDMDNDVDKARNIILDYIDTVSDVLKNPAPNVLVDEITGSGVNIKILFWIFQKTSVKSDPEARGESIKSHVMRGTKDMLLANGFGLLTSVIIEQKNKDANELHP
ncbi:mechanosensitive ion channel [Cryomorpha ignava]|uniref:Mechanosensitive ion channel n=1 Tax=Cryomorpha ignava TaxID=101383 RepID=A0A7K3WVW9_9FLAO|nr:mechanosensitive ion channel domain-containing protein [Cryomorpha ignava]NEN24745.1 mechanosensitive ion channel [Cryomorpha ignava]